MKAVLPLLVILPLSLGQTPAALAGSQSLLDPYSTIDAPTSKGKVKGHQAKSDVQESILDEASTPAPEHYKAPKQPKAPKEAKAPKAPKAPKEAKAPKAPKAPKTAKANSPSTGGGILSNMKNMKERSAEGLKGAGAKIADGTKSAGGKMAEGTKSFREHVAAGAKSSGEFLKKGALAMGNGMKGTAEKVKGSASSLGHKVKPAPTAISAKPSGVKTPSQISEPTNINGAPATSQVKARDGFPGKPLDPLADKQVIGGKQRSGLITGAFSKINPFGHKAATPPPSAMARPLDQSKATTANFEPSAATTPAPPPIQ